MTFAPTAEQRRILEAQGNLVVIANPGSGKTTTLARLVQLRLDGLPHYRGVIAISYTNRATDELRNRSLDGGYNRKGSFFGTIDKFFLTEILFPFGERVLGYSRNDLQVVSMSDAGLLHRVGWGEGDLQRADREEEVLPVLRDLFRNGNILLEAIGMLAVRVYRESRACRRYLNARYSDIIIDEYQDCGFWQHQLFLAFCANGIRGVAVGDLNQSIFAFAHKHPRYLNALTTSAEFTTFPLSINHRCHKSIIAYSTKLIAPLTNVEIDDERRVFWKQIEGHEGQVAEWLTRAIPKAARKFSGGRLNGTALLTKVNRTGALVQAALGLPNKLFVTTPLDTNATPSASTLRNILLWLFDPKVTRTELVEDAWGTVINKAQRKRVVSLLVQLEDALAEGFEGLRAQTRVFADVGAELLGRPVARRALVELESVLKDESLLHSYIPARTDEVQILTIYKAKGQEFDQIFHLDLHDGVLPFNEQSLPEDRNLHYVAITRARHASVLVTSTHRHNNTGTLRARRSSFMTRVDLAELAIVL